MSSSLRPRMSSSQPPRRCSAGKAGQSGRCVCRTFCSLAKIFVSVQRVRAGDCVSRLMTTSAAQSEHASALRCALSVMNTSSDAKSRLRRTCGCVRR